MEAVGYWIVIKEISDPITKTKGGLELTDKHDEIRYKKAEVISAGEQVLGIAKTDKILYDKHAGHNIENESNVYKVIAARDVVVKL